jgi:Sodium/hydrogen exchanger family
MSVAPPYVASLRKRALALNRVLAAAARKPPLRSSSREVEHDEDAYFILMLAIVAVAGLLAQIINLPGIVGAFLAGLAVNAAVHDKPAKEKLEFFGNSFFIPIRKPGNESHHGDTGMRGYDLPAVVKFLEIHGAISHHVLLGGGKSYRPPGEG